MIPGHATLGRHRDTRVRFCSWRSGGAASRPQSGRASTDGSTLD